MDPSTPEVTSSTTITGLGTGSPGVGGQDIAFAADGTLYLIDGKTTGDPVLYEVNSSTGDATEIARSSDLGLSGLAIRNAGTGNLLGSNGDGDELVEIDPDDGSVVERYGFLIDHVFGDMAGNLE